MPIRELRERAVRMLAEISPQYESGYVAIAAVATTLGSEARSYEQRRHRWVITADHGAPGPAPRSWGFEGRAELVD